MAIGTRDTEKPLRILQLIPSLEAGGAERACLDIAAALSAEGGTSWVFSEGGRMADELSTLGGVLVKRAAATKNPARIIAHGFAIAALARSHAIDIIHARSRAPAWSGLIAAKLTGLPYVTTFHGFYGAQNSLKRLYNSVMIRGDRVIAGSQFMASHIHDTYHCPHDRIALIPRGIDTDRFDPARIDAQAVHALRQKWGASPAQKVILLPGRLTRWKGQGLLLDAVARLNDPALFTVMVGDPQGREGYVSELKTQIDRLGLANAVHIAGHVDDMPTAYQAADIIVSASTDAEAFGRVPVEAMAMGKPIVAADHGGASETLRGAAGQTAFGTLFTPGDAAALAAALQQIPALPAPEMATAARAYVIANYSTQSMCRQTLALYRSLCAAGRAT